jgi:cytochrome c
MKAILPIVFVLLFALGGAARAENPEHGRSIARKNCARCHSIDKTSQSRLRAAPPFRTLHTRYPVESLSEALAEGIVTGHPEMPEFAFDPQDVGDLIAFLKTLE